MNQTYYSSIQTRLTMRNDDNPCADSPSPRLVSRSRFFPPNCNRAKKQRLLQSCMFVSSITSWDYGYLFFILLMTYRNFKAKTEHIFQRKTPIFTSIWSKSNKEGTRLFSLCLFLNWHLWWGQLPSSPLLCQELLFTHIRSAGYMGNTGNENQYKLEFPHFPVSKATHDLRVSSDTVH